MERWDSDGNPQPVEPGEVAAIDQMSMKFRNLRDTLVASNERALAILAARYRGEDTAGQMGLLQASLHQVMHEAFGEHGDPQSVHSFVMYLINDLCELRARDHRLGDMLNNAGSHLNMILAQLNGMAEALGMDAVDDESGAPPDAVPVFDSHGNLEGYQ